MTESSPLTPPTLPPNLPFPSFVFKPFVLIILYGFPLFFTSSMSCVGSGSTSRISSDFNAFRRLSASEEAVVKYSGNGAGGILCWSTFPASSYWGGCALAPVSNLKRGATGGKGGRVDVNSKVGNVEEDIGPGSSLILMYHRQQHRDTCLGDRFRARAE